MDLFFADRIENETAFFSAEETRHLSKSMRLKIGDKINFTEGKGWIYEGIIQSISKQQCVALIEESEQKELTENLFLAVAPTKNIARYEWMLEKCTEIGVKAFLPFLSEHSERKIIKNERLENIIIAACKQSLKDHKPELGKLVPLKDLINTDFKGNKYIAYCRDSENKKALFEIYNPNEKCLILIGPEGGFSEAEIKQAEMKGFVGISLGESRLRAETAAVAACHSVNILNRMKG